MSTRRIGSSLLLSDAVDELTVTRVDGGAALIRENTADPVILHNEDVDALVEYLRPGHVSVESIRLDGRDYTKADLIRLVDAAEAARPISVGDRVEVTRGTFQGVVGEVLETYDVAPGSSPFRGTPGSHAAIRLDERPEGSSRFCAYPTKHLRRLPKEPSA